MNTETFIDDGGSDQIKPERGDCWPENDDGD